MSVYCSVCGRELKKSEGPIGPKCLQKMRPRNRRASRISKAQYIRMWAKHDMYKGQNGEQGEDETSGQASEGEEAG